MLDFSCLYNIVFIICYLLLLIAVLWGYNFPLSQCKYDLYKVICFTLSVQMCVVSFCCYNMKDMNCLLECVRRLGEITGSKIPFYKVDLLDTDALREVFRKVHFIVACEITNVLTT